MGGRISWLLLPLLGGVLLLGGGAWLLVQGAADSQGSDARRARKEERRREPLAAPIALAPAEPEPEVSLPAVDPPREERAPSEPQPSSGADASVIAGRVFWPEGTPAEARVWLVGGAADGLAENDTWMWTKTDGLFRFPGLPAGACDVRAKAWRMEEAEPNLFEKLPWTAQFGGVAVGTSGLVLVLDPGVRQSGRIVAASGRPLQGSVFARSTAPELVGDVDPAVALANNAGEFTVRGLAPGRWEFAAQCEGFLTVRRELDVPSLEPLLFVLEAGASIRGLVLDERGVELPGVVVIAQVDDGAGQGGMDVSGELGEFELVGLSAGAVVLLASDAGYTTRILQELALAPGELRSEVVLRMPACGRISGTVSQANGAPLAEQPVGLAAAGVPLGTTTSDAQGRFEFPGVGVGEYEVRVGMLHGLELRSTVIVASGETSVIELRAPARSLRLSGRVRIEGELVADVSVTALRRDTSQEIARVESDAQGGYVLELPGAGEYWIGVWSERLGANQWIPLALPSVASFEHDFDLRLGQVSGTVWDTDGRRLAGLWVVAEQSSARELGSGFGRALSDASGDFELLLPAGRYTLRVREAEDARAPSALALAALEEVVVTAGSRVANLDLVLTPGATLEGSVHRKDGSAVYGAKLWIAPTGPAVESELLGASGRLGRFRIAGVPAGTWQVTASDGKARAKWQEVELEPGATKRLEFVLE